jgi:hypothetical protein
MEQYLPVAYKGNSVGPISMHRKKGFLDLKPNDAAPTEIPILLYSELLFKASEHDDYSHLREAFDYVDRSLCASDGLEFETFGSDFFDLCEAFSEMNLPESMDVVSRVLLSGFKQCPTFLGRFRVSRLFWHLLHHLEFASVIVVFSKVVGFSGEYNHELVESGLFDAVLDIQHPDYNFAKIKFCSRFLKTSNCHQAPFTRAVDFLMLVFPPIRGGFKSCVTGLVRAIKSAPHDTIKYLMQWNFYEFVWEILKTSEDVFVVRGCLKLIVATTNGFDIGPEDVRRLFPLNELTAVDRLGDRSVQMEILSVILNLGLTPEELGTDLMGHIIKRYFLEGDFEMKHIVFKILHNFAEEASEEELKTFTPPEAVQEWLEHFISINAMSHEYLWWHLPRYLQLAIGMPGIDLRPLAEYLTQCDDPRTAYRVEEVLEMIGQVQSG